MAQKLWDQCRDSQSAYSAVTSDLRKLRNVLEDIEEYTQDSVLAEPQCRKVLSQVSKCKAILGGLDLGLQSFRCSNKQQHVQSGAIAAIIASVQVATEGMLMVYHGLSGTVNGHLELAANEFPTIAAPHPSIASETSSDGGSDTQHMATATNMMLSNSARIVSVGGLFPPTETEQSHVKMVDATQALTSHRRAPVQSFHPLSWSKPFPDPLSYDISKAFTLLTGRHGQPDGSSHDTFARANALGRLLPFNTGSSQETWNGRPRRWSASAKASRPFIGPKLRKTAMSQETAQTYVPYRPWYSSLESPTANKTSPFRRDSAAELSIFQDSDDGQRYAHRSAMKPLAASNSIDARPTPTISVTDYSAVTEQPHNVVVTDKPPKDDDVPPTPVVKPPPPPIPQDEEEPPSKSPCHGESNHGTSVSAIPIPPTRASPNSHSATETVGRLYHITNASPPNRSDISLIEDDTSPSPEDSPTLASIILRFKACSEEISDLNGGRLPLPPASDSDVFFGKHRVIHRRASTGEIDLKSLRQKLMELDAQEEQDIGRCEAALTTLGSIENPFETNAVLSSSGSSFIDAKLPRSRSVSAPELRTPKLQPTILAHLPIPTPERSSLSEEPSDICRSSVESSTFKEVVNGIEAGLREERIEQICSSWSCRQWAKAEGYLTYHLSKLNTSASHDSARRLRHLLGVCASYRGQWQRALTCFLSVVNNKPVEDAQRLDCGDRAAFYWLGDTYAVLNRREEAFLSYCLAGSCKQSASADPRAMHFRCLLADQKTLRSVVSKATYKAIWAQQRFHNGRAAEGEILHSSIVSQAAAQARLQHFNHSPEACILHGAEYGSKQSLKNTFASSGAMLIQPASFRADSPWPMPNDPVFSMNSVAQGRLITQELDLLHAIQQYPDTLLPRKKFSLDRVSGFTCDSLPLLIATVRETLHTLAMGWSEMVTAKGLFFRVRYNVIHDHVTTTNYFAIEIIRVPLRIGYSLAVCPDSLCSARILDPAAYPNNSNNNKASSSITSPIPSTTEKEIKACLRATLQTISRRHREAPPASTSTSPPKPTQTSPPTLTHPPSHEPAPAHLSLPELASSHSTPSISARDLSTLLPPAVLSKPAPPPSKTTLLPARAKARISLRESYNELNLLGGLMR
ncbi:hypothetical protein Q7P37_003913 [Cladosporium fusiforme]